MRWSKYEKLLEKTIGIPPGTKPTAAFFKTFRPVKRARVPGRANDEVEKMIGITPALFTCQSRTVNSSKIYGLKTRNIKGVKKLLNK